MFQAIHDGDPSNDLIAIKYLETLQGIADGRATKIYLPLDTGSIYGSLAGVAELFKGAGDDPVDEGAATGRGAAGDELLGHTPARSRDAAGPARDRTGGGADATGRRGGCRGADGHRSGA